MKPLVTGNSRVFLTAGGACPTHQPLYHSCLVAGKIVKPRGDAENLESPDAKRYGQWEAVDTVRKGTAAPCSVELTGHYALNLASELLAIARRQRGYGHGSDVQLHFGSCTDPREFYPIEKALILENAFLTNWGINLPKAVGNSAVDETVTVHGTDLYEVLPMAGSIVATVPQPNIVDVISVEDCCGDCRWYAVTDAVDGSPALSADLIFTDVNGEWDTDAITSLGTGESPCCLASLGDWIVVFSTESGSLHYASKADIDAGVSNWVEIATGFTTAPTCCRSAGTMIWVGGEYGYVYKVENPAEGAVALEGGNLTVNTVNDIHALDSRNAIAVGNGGFVLVTANQKHWKLASSPVGAFVDLEAGWMIDEKTWFVGDENGVLWYTVDAGVTWVEKKDFS